MQLDSSAALPPLSRPAFDRDAQTRLDPDALAAVLASAEARFVVYDGESMLATASGEEVALLSRAQLEREADIAADLTNPLYLGLTLLNRVPVFAVGVAREVVKGAHPWLSLRSDFDLLNAQDRAIFTSTLALARWHERGAFSAATGSRTVPTQGGWARSHPQSGEEIYPRTDPAIIVLITDSADRVLLGSNILWQENRYSLLAGFVEAGESLEGAVHREIAEESGMRVTNVRYVASQPWPFPRSLMIGFRAELSPDQDPEAFVRDESELADLRWFTRDELRNPDSGVTLPGGASIARFLLDQWVAEGEAGSSAVSSGDWYRG